MYYGDISDRKANRTPTFENNPISLQAKTLVMLLNLLLLEVPTERSQDIAVIGILREMTTAEET